MNETTMKKKAKKQKATDDLRPEYDFSALKNGVPTSISHCEV